MSVIPSFPVRTNANLKIPALLSERGFSLRHAHEGDIPFLRVLYADTRADELAGVPWPAAAKQQFLDQQFDLQHHHYLSHYADADFLVIEHRGKPQGRYYLLRTAPDHLIVDICLMPENRDQGIGRALIEASQQEAASMGRGMQLQVLEYNPRARKLYEELGFVVTDTADMYHHMRWSVATSRGGSAS